MLYHLKFALFLRLRGRTDEAIENLLMSKSCPNSPVYLSNLDIHFLPQELKDVINDFKRRYCRNDVTLPSRVIAGSLLVTYYVTLGRNIDAKWEARELWDLNRWSFKSNQFILDVLRTRMSNHGNDLKSKQIKNLPALCQFPGHPNNSPLHSNSAEHMRSTFTRSSFRKSGDILKYFLNDMVKLGDDILKKSMITSRKSAMLDLIRHFFHAKTAPLPRKDKALHYIISGHALKEAGLETMAEKAFAQSKIVNTDANIN